jgi:hypothetical protein
MKNMPLKRNVWFAVLCLLSVLIVFPSPAAGNPPSQASTTSSANASHASTHTTTPSAADIAAAKASGKVWVNLSTGIYHRGGRWYGKTKDGKFMTVDDAKKAGYKAAKRD